MDTKKLVTFVDLAQTKNYSKTAERIFTTQATVSKHIMALEKEWNVELFSRAHREINLTDVGKLLLPQVKELLRVEQKIHQTINLQQTQKEQSLVIKGVPSISQYQAFDIITNFAKQNPEIKLKFSESETELLIDSLEQDEADIIFTRTFDKANSKYETIVSEHDYFVLLVPKENPLAKIQQVEIKMLQNESLLLLGDSTKLYTPVISMLKEEGVKPHILYEGRRINLILEMLNQGMGVSIMMNKSFDLTDYPEVVAIPIIPKKTSELIFLKKKSNMTNAVNSFWKFAIAETRLE